MAMVNRIIRRLAGVALIVAVALLATHAISDWHAHTYDEDHCQVCHVGHSAIPQAAPQVAVQSPAPVAALTPAPETKPHYEIAGSPSIPRAPPA
jgi:hypothetical protein